MEEEKFKAVARQLKKPEGELGKQVGEKMNESNLYINRYAIEQLQVSANDKILEIGMGNGFFVKDILVVDRTVTYTGCDFSEVMVEEARQRNEQFIKNGQAQFFLASADNLPFDKETFDKVFTVNTLYFWDHPEKILAEIHRVLKPKGQLIIAIRPKSVMEHYPFTKYGFTMFSKDDLVNLLSGNVFEVTHILEKQEPPQEMNVETIPVQTLIVSAIK
jgi:ubiquinone/menaquinone biosynthesis C-methylase UbiE